MGRKDKNIRKNYSIIKKRRKERRNYSACSKTEFGLDL